MSRNDAILLGSLSLAIISIVALSGIDAAPWAEAIGTVGAAVAAVYIYSKQRIDALAEREFQLVKDQNIAAMQVAAGLRAWMRRSVIAIQDLRTYESSNGAAGVNSATLPPFEINLDHVARMKLSRAKVIYSILEQRERAEESIASANEFTERDDAIETFYKETAKMFRRCRKSYIALADETGLHPFTSLRWELDTINGAAKDGKVRDWKDF